MNAAIISDTPGGIESNSSAYLLSSSSEAYPILAGDAFNIAVDGGSNVVVTFLNGDTTASRIASRINTAVGSQIAGNSAGKLYLQSLTTGSTSKFIVSDVVAGTLAKLGLIAGTFIGSAAAIRGVVTVSRDRLGGYVPLRTTDGRNVVTDTAYLKRQGAGYLAIPPGGTPVHGRLLFDGTNYILSYYSRTKTTPKIITFNSNLALLDNTDSLTLTFTNTTGSLNLSFPSGPGLTRDQVIDRINVLWATLTFLSIANAIVAGKITGPYQVGSESIAIAVDGGAPQLCTFTVAGATAADVVNDINTQVTGVTASTSGGVILIQSNQANGRLSSLEFFDGVGSSSLAKLGIQPGLYRGSFIAEAYGTSEIIIRGNALGSVGTIIVTGPAQTQARLGIPAG
ncbi:MAG TPA: hypothetical protein VIE65_10380, partial [Methylobacter sp.]